MRTRHRRVNRTCMPSISAFLRPSKRMIDANWEHFETKKAPRRRDRASTTRTKRRKMRAAHCPTPHPMRPSHPLARAHMWWKKYDLMRLTYRLSSFSSPLFALLLHWFIMKISLFSSLAQRQKHKQLPLFFQVRPNFFLSSYSEFVHKTNKRITVGQSIEK